MDGLLDFEIPDAGVLVALVALVATILYRWNAAYRRDFEILLARTDKVAEKREQATKAFTERIDREAAKRQAQIDKEAEKRDQAIKALFERFDKEAEKRERAIQAAFDRSGRKFETLLAMSNELAKGLAGIAERTTRNEGVLETIKAGGARTALSAPSATD